MSKPKSKPLQIIAGLDIGTTKVTCVIGQVQPEGVDVIGLGCVPHVGMKQGIVTHIDAVAESIKKAKEEAELMAGVSINEVWLGVSGSHIQSFDSSGVVAIRNKEVRKEDIQRVVETAKAIVIPSDRQVLHVLPKDFKIDGQEGILDPTGMSGVRLETSVHIITGSHAAIQNTIKCIEHAGLMISGLVLQQLASAIAVLNTDEKNLGVSVVDLGGGTCDIITYLQGSVVHTAMIPVGGQNFTQDVATGLKTTQNHAEELKKKYGCALPEMIAQEESIEVESVGGRKSRTLKLRDLSEILEARAEETLKLIAEELNRKNLIKKLGTGIVFTGAASLMPGFVEMADFIFDVPVRRGQPEKVGGLTDVVRSATYSAGVGLLLYGRSEKNESHSPKLEIKEGWNLRWYQWNRKIRDLLTEKD
ncbi:MAG: cell division protein FtsA [Bdellovibrionales bacterium]|nr:cell division protein FtsA [Bdellovibrionales bacterium]